jgi:hypothetical protein
MIDMICIIVLSHNGDSHPSCANFPDSTVRQTQAFGKWLPTVPFRPHSCGKIEYDEFFSHCFSRPEIKPRPQATWGRQLWALYIVRHGFQRGPNCTAT